MPLSPTSVDSSARTRPQTPPGETEFNRDAALPPAVREVEDFYAARTEREQRLLSERILSEQRTTLEELGIRLGISRERANQIDKKVRADLRNKLRSSPTIDELCARTAKFADPISALSRVARSIPELVATVPSLGISIADVLARLDDRFTVDKGWLLAESGEHARQLFTAAVTAHATTESLSSIYSVADELNMPAPEAADFGSTLGLRVVHGHFVRTSASVPDQLASMLALAGHPLTMAALSEGLTPHRSQSSVRNALVTDSRFIKSDRTLWALTRWSIAPYVPIHRQIAEIVDARGGSIAFDELVAEITASYDVKEFSIRTYASAGEFQISNDTVSRRPQNYTPRKSPTKTKHLYRDGSITRWRTTIAAVHLKGSAFNLPSALAALLGVGPGSPREFSSRLGPQSVMWVSVQARSGTIKRFAEDMNLRIGDDVFLEFGDDGSFDITRVPTLASEPLRAIHQSVGVAVGRRKPTARATFSVLAAALWLDGDASVEAAAQALTVRREDGLASLVRQAAGL